jgi:hypothetical protein
MPDKLAIFATLLRLSLRRSHPLDGQHPPPRRARAIAKTLDWPLDCVGQPADQPGHDPHHIPQQCVVGRMMNVGRNDRRIDAQLAAVFQPHGNGRLHQQFVDKLQRLRRNPGERPLEGIVLGHRLGVKIREPPQRQSVGNPFA